MAMTDRVESVPTRAGVIAQVGDDVEQEIADSATVPAPGEPARIERVAANIRGNAIGDVARGERDVTAARWVGRVSQVVDYLFLILYGLLGLRFVLALIAARSSAGFTQFVVAVTDPLYAPFRNIVSSTHLGDGYVVVLSLVVALVVYGLAHLGIHGLFRLVAHRQTTV